MIGSAPEACGYLVPVGTVQIQTVCRLTDQRWVIGPLKHGQSVGQVPDPDRQEPVDQLWGQLMEHRDNLVRVGEGQLPDEVVFPVPLLTLRCRAVLVSGSIPAIPGSPPNAASREQRQDHARRAGRSPVPVDCQPDRIPLPATGCSIDL
jgi:hypothetical protein